jgi:hypothetical protein
LATLSPEINVFKLFLFVIHVPVKKASVFVAGKNTGLFNLSVISEGKSLASLPPEINVFKLFFFVNYVRAK